MTIDKEGRHVLLLARHESNDWPIEMKLTCRSTCRRLITKQDIPENFVLTKLFILFFMSEVIEYLFRFYPKII